MEYKIDCKSVGARIKARKTALQITVGELYEKSGVPEDTINNIVYGRTTDPRIESLARIAVALDTTLDYIVFGTPPNAPKDEDPHKTQTNHFSSDDYVKSLKEDHAREIALLIESHDRHIKDMKDANAREVQAVREHCNDFKRARNFWRNLSSGLITLVLAMLVWFIWDILHPDRGLIRILQATGLLSRMG